MKMSLCLMLLTLLPLSAKAQGLEEFRWTARPIILFTPNADDPLFQEQYRLLRESVEALEDRRVQLICVNPDGDGENTGIFLDRSRSEYLYDYYSVQPFQLELVLVGMDGDEKYRAKNVITPVSVLLELIDGMPMRRRELRQGYGNKGKPN